MHIQQHQARPHDTRTRCSLCGTPDGVYLTPAVWESRDMRIALARRDLGRVFRLLHRLGMSQRAIAAHTGQKQSEVSEILDGRQVVAYDVLVRIGAGLGVARGSMGLEYSDGVADLVAEAVAR